MLKRMKNVEVYKSMYIMLKKKDILYVIGCPFFYFIAIEKVETNNEIPLKLFLLLIE